MKRKSKIWIPLKIIWKISYSKKSLLVFLPKIKSKIYFWLATFHFLAKFCRNSFSKFLDWFQFHAISYFSSSDDRAFPLISLWNFVCLRVHHLGFLLYEGCRDLIFFLLKVKRALCHIPTAVWVLKTMNLPERKMKLCRIHKCNWH